MQYTEKHSLSVTTDLQCISLLPAGSDLAYETMYDNDEIMGTQTMPWFDPKYLASSNPQRDVEVRLPLMAATVLVMLHTASVHFPDKPHCSPMIT